MEKRPKRNFRGLTKATAEVIILPPEPPITSSPPDSDSSMTGVMDDGGCSPAATMTLRIRPRRGREATLCNASHWIYVGDFTCADGVCSLAEIRQLVVHDDARPRRINGPSKSDKRQLGEWVTGGTSTSEPRHAAHIWLMVLVAETASPSSSTTDTCVVPKRSNGGEMLL